MPPTPDSRSIGAALVTAGLVKAEHIEEALSVQKDRGGRIVDILVQLGRLDINAFAQYMASQPGIASIDLNKYQYSEEICALVPREFAIEYQVFPIDKMGKLLTLGMACPIDQEAIEKLQTMTGLRVKAFYCDKGDILNAIAEAYAPQREEISEVEAMLRRDEAMLRKASTTRLSSISSLIRQIETLPALPQTVHKVQELMDEPDVDMDALAEVIGLDPLVSAKLLRLVNSAAFNLPKQIDSIGMAVKLLGLRETSTAVLTCSVVDVLENANDFDYTAFWHEAVFASHAAKGIMAARGKRAKTATAAGALLHDIGRFALAQASSTRYAKIDKSLMGSDLIEAETKEFSIAHPEAGFMLAEHWGLPKDIATIIRYHHTPLMAKDTPEEALVVALAAYMAELYSINIIPSSEAFAPIQPLLVPLDVTDNEAIQIYQKSAELIEANA